MPTTAEHIAARDDVDLQRRLVAAAEQAGISNAASEVSANLGRLISLTDAKALIGVLLAPPPGQNPGAVTDPILAAAVQAVLATPQAL